MRRSKIIWYLILLSLSLVACGSAGWYLVRALDDSYSKVVEVELPTLALIRTITRESSLSRRTIEGLDHNSPGARIAEGARVYQQARARNDLNLAKLYAIIAEQPGSKQLAGAVETSRAKYHASAEKYLAMLRLRVERNEADEQRRQLTEAYRLYLEQQDNVAEYAEKSASERSAQLTERATWASRFFLCAALWPIGVGLGFFTYGVASTAILYVSRRKIVSRTEVVTQSSTRPVA